MITVTTMGPVDWQAHQKRYDEYLRKRLDGKIGFEGLAALLDCQFVQNPKDYPAATFTYSPDNPKTPLMEGKPTRIIAVPRKLVWLIPLDNEQVVRIQLSMIRRSPSGLDFLVWTLLRHVCRQYYPRTRELK